MVWNCLAQYHHGFFSYPNKVFWYQCLLFYFWDAFHTYLVWKNGWGMKFKVDWLTPSQFLGTNSPPSTSTSTKVRFQDPVSNKGVRRLEMATDARSRVVQGHVVRSSIVVSPGGKVWKMCPRYETSPQRYENKHLKVWKKFLQGMKFLYRSMKKVF